MLLTLYGGFVCLHDTISNQLTSILMNHQVLNHQLIRFLWTIGLLSLLLSNCRPKDESVSPQKALTGNATLNRTLLVSRDEEILRVDAATGQHQRIVNFDNLVNIESLDYADNMIYAGAQDNSLNVIDLQASKFLWDVPLPRYELSTLSEPIVVVKDGVAYVAGISGVLFAIDVTTQKPLWAYAMNPSGEADGYYSSVSKPAVIGDKIIIGTSSLNQNYLHAIDKVTGKRLWRKEFNAVSGVIKQAGDKLLVPAHSLFALDPNTGNVIWEFPGADLTRGAGTPIVSGDKILVQGASGVADGKLYCLNLETGQKIREIDAGNGYAGVYGPMVVGNAVIGVYERGSSQSTTGNGRPFVADINTGKILWRNDDVSVESSPVYANGRLFFHGHNLKGEGKVDNNVGLVCLDATNGQLLWLNNYFRYSSSLAPIVLADNGVFRASQYTD